MANYQINIHKPEFAYKEVSTFFRFTAVYIFITGIILHLVRRYLYSNAHITGDIYKYIYFNCIIEMLYRILFLVPILIVLKFYRRKVKENGLGTALRMFEVIRYIIVFWGSILPIVTASATVSYVSFESADLFTVFGTGVCMLISGVFADKKSLKYISYFYFILVAIILIVIGILQWYFDYNIENKSSFDYILLFSYIRGFIYIIYPSIGYIIISYYMRGLSLKEHINNEYCPRLFKLL